MSIFSMQSTNDTEEIKAIREKRAALIQQKKGILQYREKLVAERNRLPEEKKQIEETLENAEPLSRSFEEFEGMRRKVYFFTDQIDKIEDALGVNEHQLTEMNKQIRDNVEEELLLRFRDLGSVWMPSRDRFFEACALHRMRTGVFDPVKVLWAIFDLHSQQARNDYEKILERVASELEVDEKA